MRVSHLFAAAADRLAMGDKYLNAGVLYVARFDADARVLVQNLTTLTAADSALAVSSPRPPSAASASMPPPAASGTSTRIGRVGKFCACVAVASSAINSAGRVMPIRVFMVFSSGLFLCS